MDARCRWLTTDSLKISDNAKKYRSIMAQALQTMGFVNYPTEYWDWSYGDKYWAYHTGNGFALYGPVK
jgi:D-alanyl-D-alanine dipeptidase